MAERKESCHRDTQEGLHQEALSSQGSSKLKKLHNTEKEKRERTEKGISSKLQGRKKGKKTPCLLKGDQDTGVPQSWGVTSKKLYRRRERKNKNPLLQLHWPAIKPKWPAKWENRSSPSPTNHKKCKSTWTIIPQYYPFKSLVRVFLKLDRHHNKKRASHLCTYFLGDHCNSLSDHNSLCRKFLWELWL